ncbi:uncharacterized protein K452DRAFT_12053 [Aplosporella prunicola CBS 121167]|uniref:Secreted protein n=1 Tax=Aplosporella prunicola CBS 121167 TaxID=1176127 RepID=A0A6A6BJY7_9PEZI|nr:uncharacterized protein K452DRAFT_12053 [Aplosporella prunicola CBS 121167]KAF2142871.1 hypothetical protein K452DRAFT_12053 [Aplosporella prunicola CBS 121167]
MRACMGCCAVLCRSACACAESQQQWRRGNGFGSVFGLAVVERAAARGADPGRKTRGGIVCWGCWGCSQGQELGSWVLRPRGGFLARVAAVEIDLRGLATSHTYSHFNNIVRRVPVGHGREGALPRLARLVLADGFLFLGGPDTSEVRVCAGCWGRFAGLWGPFLRAPVRHGRGTPQDCNHACFAGLG